MAVELWPELSRYAKYHFRQSAKNCLHLAESTKASVMKAMDCAASARFLRRCCCLMSRSDGLVLLIPAMQKKS
jgi:hypothetical protein